MIYVAIGAGNTYSRNAKRTIDLMKNQDIGGRTTPGIISTTRSRASLFAMIAGEQGMTQQERDGYIENLKYLKSIAQDDGDFVDQTMDVAIQALSIDYNAIIAEIESKKEVVAVGDVGYMAAKAHNTGLAQAVEIINKHLIEVGMRE